MGVRSPASLRRLLEILGGVWRGTWATETKQEGHDDHTERSRHGKLAIIAAPGMPITGLAPAAMLREPEINIGG